MKLPIYQVDAFADHVFAGNPAAVVWLDHWIGDETLQQIALENNYSETAFLVERGDRYHLRWFTPQVEVDPCGHATLASAHVLFRHGLVKGDGFPGAPARSRAAAVNSSVSTAATGS